MKQLEQRLWSGQEALRKEALKREQYDKPSLMERQAPLDDQVANWLQYFDW